MSVELFLEVRRGRANPPTIGLGPGQVVGPLGFGARASWTIEAPGTLPEHGFLYFDGATLFVRSVDRALPLRVDDRAVPADWTPIQAPARLSFGGAEIRLEAQQSSGPVDTFAAPEPSVDETGRYPLPSRKGRAADTESSGPMQPAPRGPMPAAGAPPQPRPQPTSALAGVPDLSARRAKPIDDEVTRLGSVDEIVQRARAARAAQGNSPPNSGDPDPASMPSLSVPSVRSEASSPRNAPQFGPPPGGARPAAPTPPAPSAAPPTRAESRPAAGGLGAKWSSASGPTKATLLLLPLMAASVWVIFFREPPELVEETAAPARASSTPSAVASSAGSSPAPTAPPVVLSPDATTSAAASVELPKSAPTRPPTERSLERKAADIVASGDWSAAAAIYEELARANPDSTAFREAARILKAKATSRK